MEQTQLNSIYGIVAGPQGKPAASEELAGMRRSLGTHAPGESASGAVAQAAIGSVSVNTGSFWSSDDLLVACDADLYCTDALQPADAPRAKGIAELIGRLYRQKDLALFGDLRGAFAVAIWDARSRRLILAVDRFGIKRLCYTTDDSEIVFATHAAGIFATGRCEKKVNLSAITDYFMYNVVPHPQTAFDGVMRVTPGECVIWTTGVAKAQQYWDMQYPEDAGNSTRELAHALSTHMEEAVRVTSADLDVSSSGCFLSGGTDSSSILGFLTRIKKSPVTAFSIGFAEERFNELEYARIAARHFQARHVEALVGPDAVNDGVNKIVAAYDEPFGNSSAIPTYCCAKAAREHGIEVLLAGDGGDELFGGNERYRKQQMFHFYQDIPPLLRSRVIEPAVFGTGLKFGPFGKLQRYINVANTGNPERYCQWRMLRVFSPEEVLGANMPFRNGHSDLLATVRRHYKRAPAQSELNRLLYIDVKMTLGDDDLPKVATTAELAGVKVRFPYLDHKLAEFSGRLPASMKVRGLEKRYLFKQATRDLLPAAILQKKKHGFGLPIGFWLKSDPGLNSWAREVLFDPRTYQRGYFRREFIEALFGKMQQDETPYFGDLLWVFLMLELWHRHHVERATC